MYLRSIENTGIYIKREDGGEIMWLVFSDISDQ